MHRNNNGPTGYQCAAADSMRASDPFVVTKANGFMPLYLPETKLPSTWQPLIDVMDSMSIVKADGTPGLLASCQLGAMIDVANVLPDLADEVDNLTTKDGSPDMALITAVFREYSFLSSAYLLEPCWERQSKELAGYGLGRPVLPKQIAGPLVKTAKILNVPPFMAYAAAYSLYNFRLADPSKGLANYDNLRLVRAFERGLDPKSSEAGFILTHVDMVKHSPDLVRGAIDIISSAEESSVSQSALQASYTLMLDTMEEVHRSMEKMWLHSKPAEYLNYRTFIFGITNQSMFPRGVVYAGQFDNKPQFFRGESGANDSMIPLLDGLLEIPFPPNPLTDILIEFRDYRPAPHREFLTWVREQAKTVGVRKQSTGDTATAALYLRLVDSVMRFRWRHWTFAREYILRRTTHPTATGGSPMVKWLPNQLFAVMALMDEVWTSMGPQGQCDAGGEVAGIMHEMQHKKEKLHEEVDKWCSSRAHE
ncbi:hypothetical protein AMS68_005628 [Peltaster fructicola]|uniref:Indoleamine 2,3-dioxygenase n=1 Tax=Peltaster fructicola TaxID=286661 RepID=A0A6H0XZL5_9PEZI|nr:hypothetical protein AMS68_005628 [Peltaster fructicola]